MKKVLTFLFIASFTVVFGQYDIEDAKKENEKDSDKNFSLYNLKQDIYVGGEFSLSLGTFGTYIYAAPMIGYDITEKFSAGFSAMYQFQRVVFTNTSVNLSAFGGGVFTRFRPIDPILMQVEYNLFNTPDYVNNYNNRVNVPAFMAGAGYAGAMGSRSYYQILLMYDFINDPNMPLPGFILEPLHLKFGLVFYLE